MSDLLSKDPVGGGTFQVRAAEDVATLDGTVRYIAGQLVDTITCDEMVTVRVRNCIWEAIHWNRREFPAITPGSTNSRKLW